MALDKEIRNKELILRLRSILEQRGMTQRDLASLLGKKEAEVSRWFSGRFCVSRANRQRLEEALGEPLTSDSTFHNPSTEIRVGIVGSGDMAGRFVREASCVDGVRVVSVFDPDRNRARSFCLSNGIGACPDTVGEFLSGVNAVYVASPVDTHCQYAALALENGRHVLCEMPFVTSLTEADNLLKLAARKDLVLLTALKTAYCPSFQQMIRVAQSGIIGEIVDVSATVTNLLPEMKTAEFANERMLENFSYPLLVFFKLLGFRYRHLDCFVRRDGEKVSFVHSSLEYDNAIGSFKVGVGVKSEGSLVVSGTRGYIYVPAPWWKPDYFEVRFENPADNKKYFFPYESAGLRYEINVWKDKINHRDSITYISREEIRRTIELQRKIITAR